MNHMKKRMAATIMTLGMAAIMMTGCGISTSFTSTTTTTTTSADGTSVTTTTTEKSGTGRKTTVETVETSNSSFEDSRLNIVNDTDFDIAEMYISFSGTDEWSDNLIAEGCVLSAGFDTGNDLTISFDADNTEIDIIVYDEDGNYVTFNSLDLMGAVDQKDIEITLEYDDFEEAYVASVF